MRFLLIIFSAFSVLTHFSQPANTLTISSKYKPLITDLNNDGRLDTLVLGSSLTDTTSFNKITISIAGFDKQTFEAKNEWTNIDSTFLKTNKNAIKSGKLFLLKAKDHSIILLFGGIDGAGYRGDFSIINIKDNKSTLIFDRTEKDIDIERPISLSDLDNNGKTEFVFRNLFEYYDQVDSLNADIGTYSPYLVYTLDNDFILNKPLTKKYNEDNFVFAGYQYSEKIKILFPRDGSKPRVIK